MKWKCPLCGGNHRTFACPQFPVTPRMHYGTGDGHTVFVDGITWREAMMQERPSAPTVYVQGVPQCACRWSGDSIVDVNPVCAVHGLERPSDADGDSSEDAAAAPSHPGGGAAATNTEATDA